MYQTSATSIFNKLIYFFVALSVITCSFDIFLQIKVSSFNVRFSVLSMILSILLYLISFFFDKNQKINIIAPYSLIIWVLLLVAFVSNTSFLARNILYLVWLVIYLGFIVCINMFENEKMYLKLFKLYMYSFGFMGMIGVMQFLLFFIGVNFYLKQIFGSGLPRINGFSYEPSYYATFLLTGFVMNLYLLNNRSRYFRYWVLVVNQLLITVAIFLSTSKLAIPVMFFVFILSSGLDIISRVFGGFKIYKKDLFVFPLLILFCLFSIYMFVFKFDKIRFLFDGLGIGGTVSHSVVTRSKDLQNTVDVFTKSPIIGYSLGGIPSAIGALKGVEIRDNLMAKKYEGLNIFMETLAGSGIVGFVFFSIFLYKIFRKPFAISVKLAKKIDTQESGILIKSVFWGGIVLVFMLNFNQNILRPFFWVHLGLLSLAFFYGKSIIREKQFDI